jgi:hypothetical protein
VLLWKYSDVLEVCAASSIRAAVSQKAVIFILATVIISNA